jgi:prevent-host-death family protein
MTKATASQLKTKLGRYMRAVKSGQEIIVTDRGQPVARLIPFDAKAATQDDLVITAGREPGAAPLGELVVRPISYRGRSTLDLLREDRNRR